MEIIRTRIAFPFLEGGGEMGELTRKFDWSTTALGNPEEWQQSLRTTVSNLLRSRFPMFLWWGADMIQFYNDAYRPSLGNEGKHPSALGQKAKECWPEIWDIIYPLIRQVQITGEATWREDQLVPIYRNGKIEDVYWTYSYSAVLDDFGNQGGILVTCTETTQKVLSAIKLEKSVSNLHKIIHQAPVAMCIFRGPDFIVETANERMFEIWGKSSDEILDKPIFDGLPEARGQGFETLLMDVFKTGKTYRAYGLPVNLPRNGSIETVFLNFVYEAYHEEDGTISGIMAVANEVTEQVLVGRKIQVSESRFRLLADSMPQFVWSSDNNGNLNYFNDAVYNYSGLNEEQLLNGGWIDIVHPEEREKNIELWRHAIETGEDFLFHHRFRNKDGDYRWQMSRAIPQKDEEGKIQMWIGTSTDIHEHKLFEEDLQVRVKEQTEDILEANQKLIHINHELARSNKNLEEFAFAASHDLKEPIRKIQFFADRIQSSLGVKFSEEESRYFSRMDQAAKRMNSLIDDLLSYSLLSMRPKTMESVNMNELVQQVLHDLDLEIEERKAKISVGNLPVLQGHRRQLQQAVQNVIANSLKFHKPNQSPEISIISEVISGREIPTVTPEKDEQFYLLKITDNGIGFDNKDAEKIFNLFTRLHGNAEYKGTGLGLSIVRKVAENHKGFVTAKGETGKGTTIELFIPILNK
ncbi:MAG TPA: PAS domain S-box protein [Flavitalea sp.]|nr:PAS domain S-box protein [Flavitalea sp.]